LTYSNLIEDNPLPGVLPNWVSKQSEIPPHKTIDKTPEICYTASTQRK